MFDRIFKLTHYRNMRKVPEVNTESIFLVVRQTEVHLQAGTRKQPRPAAHPDSFARDI